MRRSEPVITAWEGTSSSTLNQLIWWGLWKQHNGNLEIFVSTTLLRARITRRAHSTFGLNMCAFSYTHISKNINYIRVISESDSITALYRASIIVFDVLALCFLTGSLGTPCAPHFSYSFQHTCTSVFYCLVEVCWEFGGLVSQRTSLEKHYNTSTQFSQEGFWYDYYYILHSSI